MSMNRDDIIRMALEAGFYGTSGNCWPEIFNDEITVGEYSVGNRVERFAALVAAATREQCAQVCASMNWDGRSDTAIAMGDAADECAAAIRAMEVK